MIHKRIRKFNTRDTYPGQTLSNDLCQAVIAGNTIYLRGQVGQDLDTAASVGIGDAAAQAEQAMANVKVLLEELALADLQALEGAEKRLSDGLSKAKPAERPAMIPQLETVKKVKAALEEGIPMKSQTLTQSETMALVDFQLLTAKPVMIAFNTGESDPTPKLEGLGISAEVTGGLGEVGLCAKLEEDLSLMESEEADEFREAMGLEEPAVERVKQVCYNTVGLVSFLTVGEDEVRAWPVPTGIVAQMAAGTIHTDFTRGFIRAEVIAYDDLVRCGSLAQGRKEGVLRSEGKTYEVKDGDVINYLINT